MVVRRKRPLQLGYPVRPIVQLGQDPLPVAVGPVSKGTTPSARDPSHPRSPRPAAGLVTRGESGDYLTSLEGPPVTGQGP